ncbi:flagellar biosynthetic protein FliO [Natronospira bacteriovora]|uniref:Flagellar protein n=1 Tax=Natronospira bacteriovora TaxID=3069753 RepID=A0ABU0W377_9GAMM|nr:flagellar biosynthetic protein FliO [Natronospira sp. AB-CW4]MDQ2068465.1 flagellar biosynthetic protein FliO [Natronospira sp. AB-CW4]
MRRIALSLILSLPVLPALAETASPEDFQGVSGLLNVMLSLIIVLAVVFGLAWAMRRMQGYGGGRGNGMKVIAQLPLSTRERLMLVEVGRQQLLLGVSPGGIRTLHVLDEPLESESSATGESFRERLMESLKRGGVQQ